MTQSPAGTRKGPRIDRELSRGALVHRGTSGRMFRNVLLGAAFVLPFLACAKTAPPVTPVAAPQDTGATTLVPTSDVVDADAGTVTVASHPIDGTLGAGLPGVHDVSLLVNLAAIQKHPVGRRSAPLLRQLPPWAHVPEGKAFAPLRDTEWIVITGPSLVHDEKNAVLALHSASDGVVGQALVHLAKQDAKGGPFDVGVPGVKATRVQEPTAERVFLRASERLVVVVPPKQAKEYAQVLHDGLLTPKVDATEAMRLIVRTPRRRISTPKVQFPQELVELRVALVPHDDGGATLFAEGTVDPATACAEVASKLTETLTRSNSGLAKLYTDGMLDQAAVACQGGVPRLQLEASAAQLEKLLTFASMAVGLPLAP